MLVIAVVVILVVGPRDLPGMLRTIGKTVGNLRRMAGDFQRQFSDALKEADIDEVKKELANSASIGNPLSDINKSADELMNSLNLDDDVDLASGEVDKIKADTIGSKAAKSANSSAAKTEKKAISKKPPAKTKGPQPSSKRKSTVGKTASAKSPAKPAAKRKAAPKSKTMTGSKSA